EFFFSSRRRHTRFSRDWSSDVCSSDLEVAQNGYNEALLLDVDGYVAEGSGENIFIVKKGKIYTPDLTSCLEGITRASVMELANRSEERRVGKECVERSAAVVSKKQEGN